MQNTELQNTSQQIARIDSQLDKLDDKMQRVLTGRGRAGSTNNGLFQQALPELAGFARTLDTSLGKALDRLIIKGDSVKSVMHSLRDSLFSIATQATVINPLLNGLFGSHHATLGNAAQGSGVLSSLAGSITSNVASLFSGGLFGGARALGGPVQAGRAYMVGEQGPEYFVPKSAGNIVKGVRQQQNSSHSPIINVHIATPNPQQFQQSGGQIAGLLADAVRRGQKYR